MSARRAEIRNLLHEPRVQPKLRIGSSHDAAEQEADAVANKVMRMTKPAARGLQTAGGPGSNAADAPAVPAELATQLIARKGGGRPLSTAERAFHEPRFGRTFSSVRIHDNGDAARMADNLGARAFTHGQDVFLGAGQYDGVNSQSRHLMAHELTHTLQQGPGDHTVRRYTTYTASEQATDQSRGWVHPSPPQQIKVADDGKLVVGAKQDTAWANSSLITAAESVLAQAKSKVKLEVGAGTLSGEAPANKASSPKITLEQVNLVNRVGGGRVDLTADCGTAARQIMGIDATSKKFSAVIERGGVERYTELHGYHGNPFTTPARFTRDIRREEFGASVTKDEAKTRYDALTPSEKDAFDKKYGINKYAAPEVGQAITANEPSGWNFHFAGAVLKSEHDYVTAENWPAPGRTSQSWYFEMYGPHTKGQSFHEAWKDSDTTTMVVESEQARTGKTNAEGVHLVRNPAEWSTTRIAKLAKGTELFVLRKGRNWRKVEIKSGVYLGKVGWISNSYYEVR